MSVSLIHFLEEVPVDFAQQLNSSRFPLELTKRTLLNQEGNLDLAKLNQSIAILNALEYLKASQKKMEERIQRESGNLFNQALIELRKGDCGSCMELTKEIVYYKMCENNLEPDNKRLDRKDFGENAFFNPQYLPQPKAIALTNAIGALMGKKGYRAIQELKLHGLYSSLGLREITKQA